jgi:broad specificity phosphatase PhoE
LITALCCSELVDTLLLARHAFAASNSDGGTASCTPPGEGLTAEGVEQGRMLAQALADERIDLGVSTELRRTRETLELALAGREIPRIVVPELNEIDFGRFDGGPLDDYRGWAWAAPADVPAPGRGESRADGAARYARGLRLLLSRPEPVVLVVGHALSIRYVVDAAEGLVPAARMAPVAHASPQRLSADDVDRAASLLESWSATPRFRDPSKEG